MDDVSERYWTLGVYWLTYSPPYTFIRENAIGSQPRRRQRRERS